MGFGGISIWQLIILLVIVLLVFGSKRLRNLGPDLGSALKGFRSAMKDDEKQDESDEDSKVVSHVQHSEQATGEEHPTTSGTHGQSDTTHRQD